MYFTNVKYLKALKEETSARSRLKNLLTLLMRLLAFAAMIIAFAYPVVSPKQGVKSGIQAISIYVDNSFSMQAKRSDVPLLDKAKQTARELVNAYNQGDKFHIITNDPEHQNPFMLERSDALDFIDNIDYTPVVQSLNSISQQQSRITKNAETLSRTNYLISDFQRSISQDFALQDSTMQTSLIPIQSPQQNNVFIDSAWFEGPIALKGQPNNLIVRVKNISNDLVENVRLSINYQGRDMPIGVLDVKPDQPTIDTFQLNVTKTGWQTAQLEINDYPIRFDDSYFISFLVPDKIKVLVIYDQKPNPKLQALYRGLSGFQADFTSASSVDYNHLDIYNLVVVQSLHELTSGMSSSLVNYVKSGKNLMIIPSENSDLESYNALLSSLRAGAFSKGETLPRDVGSINRKEQLFSDVFTRMKPSLSLFQTHTSLRYSPRHAPLIEPILTYRDHSLLLVKSSALKGVVFILAAPLEEPYNTLTNHAELFVPLMFKSALSGSYSLPLSYTIGRGDWVEVPTPTSSNTDEVYHLSGQNVDIIPKHIAQHNHIKLNISDQIKKSGFYSLSLQNIVQRIIALNYDRRESDIRIIPAQELSKKYRVIQKYTPTDIKQFVEDNEKGKPLWKWALIFALIALALEQLIIRYWKI